MRRLVALISAQLFLEAIFFSVLVPLLPELKHDLHLSTFQTGLLVAMFGLGAIVGAIPAAVFAARVGVKPTAVIGIVILGAMSVLFGVAHSYELMLWARLAQGVGSGACITGAVAWLVNAAPIERRGELLGVAFGCGAAGSIMGPVFGGVAASVGRAPAFAAIAAIALLLGVVALRFPAPLSGGGEKLMIRAALVSRRIRTGTWLLCVPAMVLGALDVLAPLQLHGLGARAGGVAAIFGVAAAAGVLVRPLVGRWSDRRGRLLPIRLGLLASVPILLVLPWLASRWPVSVLIVIVLIVIGILWAPLMAMLADDCASAGVPQLVAALILNIGWSPGIIVGSAAGGAVAQAAGQRSAYAALAVVLLLTVAALRHYREAVVLERPILPSPGVAGEL